MATSETAVLEVLSSDLTFLPNPEQRKLKESFWVRWQDNPFCEPSQISVSDILKVTGDARCTRWWSQAGFKEWFRNQEEFKERVASLAHAALDSLEVILASSRASDASKVAAAKLLMEVARKMPSATSRGAEDGKFLDKSIAQMTQEQLKEFLSNKQLKPVGSE